MLFLSFYQKNNRLEIFASQFENLRIKIDSKSFLNLKVCGYKLFGTCVSHFSFLNGNRVFFLNLICMFRKLN